MPTLADWIEHCTEALEEAGVAFGHGTVSARDEAAWMVLHCAGLDPLDAAVDARAPVSEAQGQTIASLLQRRIRERLPLAYLLGEAWFCGLRFEVTPDVLVPRSPIAELVTEGFAPWLPDRPAPRVLDLCTGGGCIAVATALALPSARVTGADLSEAALAVARRNAVLHGVDDRVRWVRSDLFASLRGEVYDLVVSNPPYVPRDTVAGLPPEFHAEPGLGLASGPDGLDAVLRILHAAPDHLASDGALVCEVGESADRLEAALPGAGFTWLEFEHGGDGVFVIDTGALRALRPAVEELLESRNDVG